MTRLLFFLLSTVAPSERFPVAWARLNRLARFRRPDASTLLARIPKPDRARLRRDISAGLDWLAVTDDAVNEAMAVRLGRAAVQVEEALDAADTSLRRYWAAPGEAPAVVAAASATLAAFVIGLAGLFPAGVGAPRSVSVRPAAASAPADAVEPQAGAARSATAAPEAAAAAPAEPPAAPATAAVPAPAAVQGPARWTPPVRGALPIGKGMWLYVPERVEGGNPHAIVAKANAIGLTHLYVRTGSSKMGFYAQDFLNQLLPIAHAHGIRVYGWDFPYFRSWSDDVYRALEAITYTTPDGHRIDGFSADIETESEGTQISAHHANEYGAALRRLAGPDYPLIATVPRPSHGMVQRGFPYAELAPHFDAFAPMVYWMQRDPVAEVVAAMDYLTQFGRPVMPVGQAYDGGLDGGHPGVPSAEAIISFMQAAEARGAPGVSFWSWQHADEQAWHAIHVAAEFQLAAGTPEQLPRGMIVAYQAALAQHGFAVQATGVWDGATTAAAIAYQQAVGLPASGIIDEPTLAALLRPFRPPTTYR
jgi:hypothetical protein